LITQLISMLILIKFEIYHILLLILIKFEIYHILLVLIEFSLKIEKLFCSGIITFHSRDTILKNTDGNILIFKPKYL